VIRISKTELKKYIEEAFEEELYRDFSPEIRERANVPPKKVLVCELLNTVGFIESLIAHIEDRMTTIVQNNDDYYDILHRHRMDCKNLKPIPYEETDAIALLKSRGYNVSK